MFGAKIKKWIEIVNPRKKSNKKKNANSSTSIKTQQYASNDSKVAVYHHSEVTSVSSPGRRSEISPIQNLNGRRGWHSPNQEAPTTTTTTTTSSNKLNSPMTKSKASDMHHIKAENSAENSTVKCNNYLTTAPTTFYQMKELDQSMMYSSASSSSMNNNNNNNQNSLAVRNVHSSNRINNNSLRYSSIRTNLPPPPLQPSTQTYTYSSSELLNDKQAMHMISSSSSSINSATTVQRDKNDNHNYVLKKESKYGKIQPIGKNPFISASAAAQKNVTTLSSTNIDYFNGNSSDDIGLCESELLPSTSNIFQDANSKMKNEIGVAKKSMNNFLQRTSDYVERYKPSKNNSFNSASSSSSSTCFKDQYVNYKDPQSSCGGRKSSFSTFKLPPPPPQALISNTTMLYPPGHQHQQQYGQNRLSYHVINHVSSPESAYSTGYSTDGNSPGGCSNTPDSYYINIRTGIHYFPRNVNVVDPTSSTSNFNRFKTDLNRIEEKNDEHQIYHTHKRTESCDIKFTSSSLTSNDSYQKNGDVPALLCQSPILRKNILMTSQLRTPSPRQRSRIRTNPWISSAEPELIPLTNNNNNNSIEANKDKKKDRNSTGSTTSSSGINMISNSDSNDKERRMTDSDSSSTEKPTSKMLISPKDFRKKFAKKDNSNQLPISISSTQRDGSDDDETLNEIGKFDESYVYEKEIDFLSDSDRTDCVSDLGQEAGDECESTDDLLDDCVKKLNVVDSTKNKSASIKKNKEQQKKRKKLVRKKTKNVEVAMKSPTVSRGCRSVGGTPVSVRRNEKTAERRQLHTSLLSHRSNSLTFNEVHLIHSRMLAISDSEKNLIKADLEADVKYRQLIHEAESILVSMKSNLSVPKESIPPTSSAVSSPRRLTNKRVEMLKNCEIDLKRELAKTSNKVQETPLTIINKRLEMLRYETSMSAPSSPKTTRVAPVKTHLSNFMCQNERDLMSLSPKPQKKKAAFPISNNIHADNSFLATSSRNKKDVDSDSESDVKSSTKVPDKENIGVQKNIPIQFRSVASNNNDLFFPQSEPLKRKIYSRNLPLEKNHHQQQQALKDDSDSDFPKKALLQKIEMLRKERQQKTRDNRESSSDAGVSDTVPYDSPKRFIDEKFKQKLIMKTIEDIKRSLEDQSLELNELHDSDT